MLTASSEKCSTTNARAKAAISSRRAASPRPAARVAASAPAEPADGLFWTMVGREDPAIPPYERLDALLALGLRSDRPGLSVIPVAARLTGGPGHWADLRARAAAPDAPASPDFGNVLPGGELGGLHSLVNEAEVLKLVSLLFRQAANPGAVAAAGAAAVGDRPLDLQVLRDVAGCG